MIHSVSTTSHVPLTDRVSAQSAKPAPSKKNHDQSAKATQISDSVQLSSAATAALREATETQTQTAQEARNGDHQAQRLLQKETAQKLALGGK